MLHLDTSILQIPQVSCSLYAPSPKMKHPRKISMNQRSEFVLCREKGVSKAGKYIVLSTCSEEQASEMEKQLVTESLPHLKVGYITSKKAGKAHQRNAIRRKLRVITQKHGDRVKGNRYIIVIARWRAAEATFAQLEKDWLRLAKRLDILEN